MNPLALPWSLVGLLLLTLLLLFLREVLFVFRLPSLHPERKVAMFNSAVLLLFLAASAYGAHALVRHDAAFASIFPRYPAARYAPERELMNDGDDWIYVSKDSPQAVVTFYRTHASSSGYMVTLDDASSSSRILLSRGGERLFLTAVEENEETVLYFSTRGELHQVNVPSH